MIGEHKFVVDRVLASLASRLEATEEKYSTIFTHIHGRVKFHLVGSDIGFSDKKPGPPTSVFGQLFTR